MRNFASFLSIFALAFSISNVTSTVSDKVLKKFKKFTASPDGCPCWWDLSQSLKNNETGTPEPYSCACCRKEGIQCGYPMHNWCQDKKFEKRGCPGVPGKSSTLSQIGFPCLDDKDSRDCAWCTHDATQCAPFAPGPIPGVGDCFGTSMDCRTFPWICDPNADCVDSGMPIYKGASETFYNCQCTSGFVGNGISCFDATSGIMSTPASPDVCFRAVITTDFIYAANDSSPADVQGVSENNMIDDMENMLCTTETLCAGCSEDIVTCQTS